MITYKTIKWIAKESLPLVFLFTRIKDTDDDVAVLRLENFEFEFGGLVGRNRVVEDEVRGDFVVDVLYFLSCDFEACAACVWESEDIELGFFVNFLNHLGDFLLKLFIF